MSAATFVPAITEATPRSDRQREAAARGHKGFRVSASGNSRINGLKVVAYLVQVMPDGYLKCYCQSGKLGRECCHKHAVREHVKKAAVVEKLATAMEKTSAPWEVERYKSAAQANFACTRPRFEMTAKERRETAVLATTGDFSLYRS